MRHLLLFDAACGICTWASRMAKRIDRRQEFTVEPYQAYTEEELARRGLSHAACDRQLQVSTARGKVHSGAFAVNYFLWRQFPWSLLVGILYVLPVLLLLELAAYHLIAANRDRISAWLGLTACAPRNR